MGYYLESSRDLDKKCSRGDIFYINSTEYSPTSEQQLGRPGIIVSNDMANKHSPNVSVVLLTTREEKPLPTHVVVDCKVPSTALCEGIQTVPKKCLGNYIRTCTSKEMEKIDKALSCALGLVVQTAEVTISDSVETPVQNKSAELLASETERKVYKKLYSQLLRLCEKMCCAIVENK